MTEEKHPNPEEWDKWENFPEGPVKTAINTIWKENVESEEKVGAHFALQVRGDNPISGYRVYVV